MVQANRQPTPDHFQIPKLCFPQFHSAFGLLDILLNEIQQSNPVIDRQTRL